MFIRIKELRTKYNYTQDFISNYLGITRSLYSLYETGKRKIPVKLLSRLANLYNTSIDYIIEDTDRIKPHKKNY